MLKRLFVSSCPFLKGKNRRYCYTQPNSEDIAGTLIAETSKQKCAVPKELKNIKEQLTNQINAIEKMRYYTNEQTFIIDSMSTMQNCTFIFIFLTFIRSIFH